MRKNSLVIPQRTTWKEILDKMQIGQSQVIPFSKMNSVSNCVTLKFHLNTNKRFRVSYKDEKPGQARVTRLADEPQVKTA